MSSSQNLGGASRCGRVLGPSLDKIIKNAAWRKHSHVVSAAKSALDKLETISDLPASSFDPLSPLAGISHSDAEFVLTPVVLALETAYSKVVEPTLDCVANLFSLGIFRGEIDGNSSGSVLSKIVVELVCKMSVEEEQIELGVLRVLLSAVRSPFVLIRGDSLVTVVKTCYNVYLGGLTGTNQICAKSVLAQIMIIVFARAEADSVDVDVKSVYVSELLEFSDKNLNEGSSIHFSQNFVNEVMAASEGATDGTIRPWLDSQSVNGDAEDKEGEAQGVSEGAESGNSSGSGSKIREDVFLLFRNLCKLSMKFSSQDNPDDEILTRGKILSLELLKVVMDNAGPIWRTNDRQVVFYIRVVSI